MSGGDIFRLVLLGLVFVVWIVMAFGLLGKLRARAVSDTGQGLPGPRSAAKEWANWFRAPEDRRERNTFLFLTFVLVAMAAMQAMG